jgi:capsule biosynthesis phosphatase
MNPSPNKRVVFDIDGVICKKDSSLDYVDREPHSSILAKLRDYDRSGYYIILYTARNMNTHEGRIGRINADTAKTLLDWLEEHDVPHDEIHYGKPWCGHDGFYVDDKAIRPTEFLKNSKEGINKILTEEEEAINSIDGAYQGE